MPSWFNNRKGLLPNIFTSLHAISSLRQLAQRTPASSPSKLRPMPEPPWQVSPVYAFTEAMAYTQLNATTDSAGSAAFDTDDFTEDQHRFRADYLGHQFWTDLVTIPAATTATLAIPHRVTGVTVTSAAGPAAGHDSLSLLGKRCILGPQCAKPMLRAWFNLTCLQGSALNSGRICPVPSTGAICWKFPPAAFRKPPFQPAGENIGSP